MDQIYLKQIKMEIEMNNYELMAINQALFFFRFKCLDSEAVNVKCSSFLANAHQNILVKLNEFYIEEGIVVNYDGFIEDQDENYMQAIIATIKNIEHWTNLSSEIKIEQIIVLTLPYKIKDETIEYLINL